jgi:hypothetical protein
MKNALATALFCLLAFSPSLHAQQPAPANDRPASAALATLPWEYGPFFAGGVGTGDRADFSFANAGVRLGRVLTNQHLPGLLRGQFEYAGELMPYWQSFTPPPNIHNTHVIYPGGTTAFIPEPYNGGTFSGISITPIILRWDLKPSRRIVPFLQGAGGVLWTNHKYPPDIIAPAGKPGRTSVWNFTPQFGIGAHYFLRNGRSIELAANAIHISSASLGDRNPGVNASVQFQIGYTFWK